jgi:ATP-dependent RNA helicase DDX42
MGWFDEEDDDDEEEEQQHAPVVHVDEEDPLDAYMKSLDTDTGSSATVATRPPRAGRLDLENEEEATSHWEEPLRTKHGDEDAHESAAKIESAASRQALENTFHRAGGNKQEPALTLTPIHHDEMAYPDFEKSFWTACDTSRGHEWRHQHQVTCSPGTVDPIVSFQECRNVFGDGLFAKIERKGFTSLTLVQSQTIPVALAGMDALVTASTGSGKTLAYVWPMVVHIAHQVTLGKDETGPIAIVLVPTRELALQVHKHVKAMLSSDYTSLAITGGISNYHLLQDSRKGGGCHAVVATPGRLLDLLGKKKGLSLGRVTFCVLDEADKMLDMGFESQVTEILKNVRPDRQSLLLSATMGRKVERLARQWLSDPARYD